MSHNGEMEPKEDAEVQEDLEEKEPEVKAPEVKEPEVKDEETEAEVKEESDQTDQTEEKDTNDDQPSDEQPSEEAEVEHTEDFEKLIEHGIDPKVAEELENIYKTGILAHSDLDSRALDALKEFPAEGGVAVLKEFKDSNLEHVSNKSAYLCGVMKTYRQKHKLQGSSDSAAGKKPGPDEAKLKEILERTGYPLDVTTGQRKYGGPPPDWNKGQPSNGHEVFCGKIPKDLFEDELIPLFEKCGPIWDLRLMMDPMTGLNRGYCFVTFCERDGALEAVRQLDNYEIKPGKKIKVNISVANLRLFVGNIPKSKSRDEIVEEFSKLTEGLADVIIYSSPDEPKKKNRGFAFLEFDSHKSASAAKRRIGNGRTRVWGCDIIVDWADPQEEPDTDTMTKVKVLYVRNLKADISEEQLKERFEPFGKIERVKKIKDYGFIHFEDRDAAVKAMQELNGAKINETEIQVSLAKPPSENKQKEKRRREQQARMMAGRMFDEYWAPSGPSPSVRPPPSRGRQMRPSRGGRGAMGGGGGGGDYGYDYYGYDDYRGGYADDYYGYGEYGYDDCDYGYGGGYGGPGPRGRGGRGGPPPPPPGRGRGGVLPRGARGGALGALGGVRGPRGARGLAPPRGAIGRGARGGAGGRGGQQRAGKRKAGGEHNQGFTKKRSSQDNWGAQPIAQQPLNLSGGYDDQWYQDSYGDPFIKPGNSISTLQPAADQICCLVQIRFQSLTFEPSCVLFFVIGISLQLLIFGTILCYLSCENCSLDILCLDHIGIR